MSFSVRHFGQNVAVVVDLLGKKFTFYEKKADCVWVSEQIDMSRRLAERKTLLHTTAGHVAHNVDTTKLWRAVLKYKVHTVLCNIVRNIA